MCPHVGPSGGTARAQLHCLGKRKEVEFLTSCSYQRVVFVFFVFLNSSSLLKLLVMSTAAGSHLLSWKGATVLLIMLFGCIPPAVPPPPSGHSSHSKCLSLAQLISRRSKKDWFVCVQRQREGAGARMSKRKGKDGGEGRGRLIPSCVCVKDSHHQSVRSYMAT